MGSDPQGHLMAQEHHDRERIANELREEGWRSAEDISALLLDIEEATLRFREIADHLDAHPPLNKTICSFNSARLTLTWFDFQHLREKVRELGRSLG